MRNATATYTSSASTDVVAYEDLPNHHLLAVRNLIATTNDESYQGSASELPPATSHGYAEWDFSGVPDLMMFHRFLDAADYWFGYSDDSSVRSYDPAPECFVVVADEHADGANGIGVGDGDEPQNPGSSTPPPCRREASTSTRSWPKRASSRPSSRKNTGRYGSCAPPSPEKPRRAANARELGKQDCERIDADFNVNNPNTLPRASQKIIAAATLLRAMPAPSTPEAHNLHCEAQALIE
jgi:hypothetical protein